MEILGRDMDMDEVYCLFVAPDNQLLLVAVSSGVIGVVLNFGP
jgi:hypothetical protein